MKKALITGITGQDGSYLAELLLHKGYEIHGMVRRTSTFNRGRIEHLRNMGPSSTNGIHLHYGDITDSSSVNRILSITRPDEVYNLAAQSHVGVSFGTPEHTAQVDALGPLRLLDSMKSLGLEKTTRFYQASTSELYGLAQEIPQNESTPFYPRSPYAVAKLYGHWITINFREAYGFFSCNGIMFNHESPRRGENFVTRKITLSLANILAGKQDTLYLGNLNAKRDWGYAKDYVEGMWLTLQQDEPDDYVFATGVQSSVRDFVQEAFALCGMELVWSGQGVEEEGVLRGTKQVLVKVDPNFFRPTEVETLKGDYSKAREILGWTPKTTLKQLIRIMVKSDLELCGLDPVKILVAEKVSP